MKMWKTRRISINDTASTNETHINQLESDDFHLADEEELDTNCLDPPIPTVRSSSGSVRNRQSLNETPTKSCHGYEKDIKIFFALWKEVFYTI